MEEDKNHPRCRRNQFTKENKHWNFPKCMNKALWLTVSTQGSSYEEGDYDLSHSIVQSR